MENEWKGMIRMGTTLVFGANRRWSSNHQMPSTNYSPYPDPRKLSIFTKGSGNDMLTSDSTIWNPINSNWNWLVPLKEESIEQLNMSNVHSFRSVISCNLNKHNKYVK